MQLLEGDAGISSVLEEADGGCPGGSRYEAGVGIVGSDAADGKNGKGHGAADIAQMFDALRRAEFFF